MHPIENIEHQIRCALPSAWTRLDRPTNAAGEWWLDIRLADHIVRVQWRPTHGFGVTASDAWDGYGEGPEEVFEAADEAVRRIVSLLRGATMKDTTSEILAKARSYIEKGWTQGTMARRLGSKFGRPRGYYCAKGPSVFPSDPKAVCWCALGALAVVGGESSAIYRAHVALEDVMGANIAYWNDRPGRTQAEVIEAFNRAEAIALAREGRYP